MLKVAGGNFSSFVWMEVGKRSGSVVAFNDAHEPVGHEIKHSRKDAGDE